MRSLLKPVLLGVALLLGAAPLSAQATRTWISGVGDDANPGSRTAPCKTFAGAISKTAANGEIDCLDPGGFGAVTITKAITLDGGGGQVGSILVSGTNAINIVAGANDVVILRNLRLQGIGTGLNGIRFTSGKALIIENCTIDGFLDAGIDIALTAAGSVSVINTNISGLGVTGERGIYIENTTNSVKVDLTNVSIWNAGDQGISCNAGTLTGSHVTVTTCSYGVVAYGNNNIQFDSSNISNNSVVGLRMAGGAMRIADCVVSGNAEGVYITAGTITSFGNNRIAGNGSLNGPLSTPLISMQ